MICLFFLSQISNQSAFGLVLQHNFLWLLQCDNWHASSQYTTFSQPEHKRRRLPWRWLFPQLSHVAWTRTKVSVTLSSICIVCSGAITLSPHISFCSLRWMPVWRLISFIISRHETISHGISKSMRWPLSAIIVTVRMATLREKNTNTDCLSLCDCCKHSETRNHLVSDLVKNDVL